MGEHSRKALRVQHSDIDGADRWRHWRNLSLPASLRCIVQLSGSSGALLAAGIGPSTFSLSSFGLVTALVLDRSLDMVEIFMHINADQAHG